MLPKMGKISPDVFERVIKPRLGAGFEGKGVVVGPQNGVDCAVLRIGGKFVVVETDPFYVAKELGFELATWFAVNILASDVASMGAKPDYLCVDLNLPLEMTDAEFEEMWAGVHKACKELGISVVSGHTARYPGCTYPMVGGAVMMGVCDKYVTPAGAKPGDALILTKGAAIEASALLSHFFRPAVVEHFGEEFAKKANKIAREMSVVEDALTAFGVDGGKSMHGAKGAEGNVGVSAVHAMHDATECGVYGALCEMSEVSKVGMKVRKKDIIVKPEVEKMCWLFQIDPYVSISEGTLLISAAKESADGIISALERKHIAASVIGEVVMGAGVEVDGKPLAHPREDPFWNACGGKTIRKK
ncbi:MAG: AIR synthase family protein [Candidatus Burarchaeum sp.]|nr:AIR synthase family protein [Candidatus Burarchaeum sp.]MDO8339600.1 AIR synthase family protein [Candidatus Burarchaeum sp.]